MSAFGRVFEALVMRSGILAQAASMLAICGVSSASAAVFGSDGRHPLSPVDFHLNQQIGTLVLGQSGPICSAFCVAPDIIATASHCIFGTDRTSGHPLSDIRFKRGSDSTGMATPIAGAATANQSQHIIAGTRRLRVAPPIGAHQDWAVLRLERPACEAGGLNFREASTDLNSAEPHHDQTLSNIAMHRDEPDFALRHSGPCAIQNRLPEIRSAEAQKDFADPSGLIFHDCDTGAGSSGSPLFAITPLGPEVIGINVGTYVVSRSVVSAAANADQSSTRPVANTAIDAAAFRQAISSLAQRDLLEDTADVAEVQALLRKLNIFQGPSTGTVSPELVSAITQFERAEGIEQTGLASRSILSRLRAATRIETH